MRPPTPEQNRAIEALDRDVLLEAGAGTGKTRVLVDRYCDAAVEVGIEGILAFTFTERAAAELRHRIRLELARRASEARASGEEERARDLDELATEAERAWISTIHGFCRRLLSGHPVALGLDPRFRVLDETEAERVAGRAFDEALEELLGGSDPGFARLVAAMRIPELRTLVRTAHDELRSQGREATLPPAPEPDPGAAIAELAAAAERALAEADGKRGGSENHDRLAAAAGLDPATLPSEAEIAALELRSSAQAFGGPECEGYKRAWGRARTALAERAASEDYGRIAELLARFAERYAELKAERSGLDFEDLQLEARRLLRERPKIAAVYRERLRHIMVDEFQDTNPVQLDLVRLLQGPGTQIFCVGDEFQSIYGFRHADLEVFRRERRRFQALPDSRAEVMPLSGNFRSLPEIVAAANALGTALLDDFAALTVGEVRGAPDDPEPRVELLLTAAGDAWKDEELGIRVRGDYPSAPDRIAEARLVAARLRELADAGVPRGDMVVLLRAFTHIAAFEEELERVGLRPYVVGGRGYWSQQQVDDVRRLLGLVANPLDDECLLGALASPACGVRPDVLWLLRRAANAAAEAEGQAPRRHLWPLVERAFGTGAAEAPEAAQPYLEAIPAEDAERLSGLCGRLESLREQAPRISLEFLVERAVSAFGYDLATLMFERGARRYANVRKLMRLARDYERGEGRDLRGFLDYLGERAARDREGEAATEAEGHDGVRVMTVHAAKGLEFPVVTVADLGRELITGGRPPPVAIGEPIPEEGEERPSVPEDENGRAVRVGIRLARFGAKAVGLFGYDGLLERAAEAEAAESCRLAYVAATRAADRLILSGRYHPRRLGKPVEEGVRPGTPISERLMRAFAIPADGEDGTIEVPAPAPRPGLEARFAAGRIAVRFQRPDREAFAALVARPAANGERAIELGRPPLARPTPLSEPAAGHLSYSALAVYGRCGYRFFAERVLGLPGAEVDARGDGVGAPAASRFGFGNAIHGLLEWSARHGWREPDPDLCRRLLRRERLDPGDELMEKALGMVAGWLRSDLLRDLASTRARVRPEMPFILPLGGSVIRGTMDLFAEIPGEPPLVVDYKTDSLADADLDSLVDRYGIQRQVYALAGARGAERIRTAYVFLERPDSPVATELDGAALATARDELEHMIRGVREGRFAVTEHPHRALCRDCPARERLCVHPPERTDRRLR